MNMYDGGARFSFVRMARGRLSHDGGEVPHVVVQSVQVFAAGEQCLELSGVVFAEVVRPGEDPAADRAGFRDRWGRRGVLASHGSGWLRLVPGIR